MTTLDDDSIFVDTNILIYAAIPEAPLNRIALSTIERLYEDGRKLWISRQVLREYLFGAYSPAKLRSATSHENGD